MVATSEARKLPRVDAALLSRRVLSTATSPYLHLRRRLNHSRHPATAVRSTLRADPDRSVASCQPCCAEWKRAAAMGALSTVGGPARYGLATSTTCSHTLLAF